MMRRAFIGQTLKILSYALGAGFVAYPIFSFLTYRKTRKKTVVFHPQEQQSLVNFKEGVYLINAETQGHMYALSARCTHLGCTLNFDPVSGRFKCPCHGSVFSLSGRRLGGPAERDLDTVPLSRKDNKDIILTLTL